MMRQIAWKECREGMGVWAVMALLGVAAVSLATPLIETTQPRDPEGARSAFIGVTFFVLCVAYGVTAGAMLLAGEREGGTLPFLDHLWPRRWDIWERKLRIGAALALAQGCFLALLLLLSESSRESGWPGESPLLPLMCLEGLLWGMLGSALCRTVLAAAFVGGVFGVGGWSLAAAAGMAFGPVGLVIVRMALDVGAVIASKRIFCRTDRERESPKREEHPRRPLGSVIATAWLAWRQGTMERWILAGLALVIGLVAGQNTVVLWPGLTLLLGTIVGTNVWCAEQADGSRRFLADQRLSLTAVWLVKTVVGLFALLMMAVPLVLGAALLDGSKAFVETGSSEKGLAWLQLVFQDPVGSFGALTCVWASTGFAAGQLFSLVCRKRVIAVIAAFVFGSALSLPWLPSLAAGGLTVWHVLVPPVLLLLATRLVLAAWCADRLGALRPILILIAFVILAIGWEVGCLAWRVLGVRDVGDPFDVAAFRAELSALERRESARLIRSRVVENISASGLWGPDRLIHEAKEAVWLLVLRARELQAHGNDQGALACLLDSLALSRHLHRGMDWTAFSEWRSLEFTAADGLARWAAGAKSTALLRRALAEVARHEEALPPASEFVKTVFVDAHTRYLEILRDPKRFWEARAWDSHTLTALELGLSDLLVLGDNLPWERERTERLLRYRFARSLETIPFDARLERQLERSFVREWYGPRALDLVKLVVTSGLRRIRGLRLQLALVLFEREKGRPARSLDELVPGFLAALPLDPGKGQSFLYRLAGENEGSDSAPGQGIISLEPHARPYYLVPRLR